MKVISCSNARRQLKSIMDCVIHDKQEVVVYRKNGEAAIFISLEEWNAINETLHLLSTLNNASRLRSAIAQLNDDNHK